MLFHGTNSLLWIAAALGEDKNIVISAAKEAEGKGTYAAKCGVVRKAIPFSRVKELAEKRFDEYLKAHPEAMEDADDENE